MLFAERLNYEPAAVVGTMKANVRVREPKIRLRWIEEYQSENCWNVYASNDTHAAKVLRMARVMTDLGMNTKNLDEMAFARPPLLPCTRPIETIRLISRLLPPV